MQDRGTGREAQRGRTGLLQDERGNGNEMGGRGRGLAKVKLDTLTQIGTGTDENCEKIIKFKIQGLNADSVVLDYCTAFYLFDRRRKNYDSMRVNPLKVTKNSDLGNIFIRASTRTNGGIAIIDADWLHGTSHVSC